MRFADERPPTPEDLRKIFNISDYRARVSSAVVAFSGVRLEVWGNYLGTDGLKLKDFHEHLPYKYEYNCPVKRAKRQVLCDWYIPKIDLYI